MPASLLPVAERLQWIGPKIGPDDLPRLKIEHHGGGKATLLDASWGAEPRLTPDLMPDSITDAQIVHIAALSSAERQLRFLRELKQRRGDSSRKQLISVGTYAQLVYGDTDRVRHLFEQADVFFMNENEATGLFGSVSQARTRAGAVLFVTLDAEGALVIDGEQVTHMPGHPVPELDPTGAGDTFCGAALAGLVNGQSPQEAAREAVKLAAQTVSAVGPAALLAE
jgi:sugar/nucleoside kinase (ribokinase family)